MEPHIVVRVHTGLPIMSEPPERRIKLIADVAQAILRDPLATITQKLEAMKMLEKHAKPVHNYRGNSKNLKNQKAKKNPEDLKKLLG